MNTDEMPYTDIIYDATSPKRELARLRDELKLQIHLGKAEAKAHWEELETKWTRLQAKIPDLQAAGEESKKEIGQAVKDLMSELVGSYRRLRDVLADI